MRRLLANFKARAKKNASPTHQRFPNAQRLRYASGMLKNLLVSNFAIIDRVELDLDHGLTVVTGETGAGKSIIVGALGLLLGGRGDQTLIRDGAERCEIVALFDVGQQNEVLAWLESNELPAEEGQCHIRRVLKRGQSSRAFINGIPVPAAVLAELGSRLLDIHGQHENQRLMLEDHQRTLLDGYGALGSDLRAVANAWAQLDALQREQRALEQAGDDESQRQLLRYQVEELQVFNPGEQEIAGLEQEHALLSRAGDLLAAAEQGETLIAGEDQGNISTMLAQAVRVLQSQVRHDERLSEPLELLESASSLIDDAHGALCRYRDSVELDPQRLHELDERLGQFHALARKHRVEPTDLAGHLESLSQQLARLDNADQRRLELDSAIEKARQDYAAKAERLTHARQKAAATLAGQVTEMISELGMAEGRLRIAVEPDKKPSIAGVDRIVYQVQLNSGHAERPLARVASGGELARISLAIQVATQQVQARPTLIFDEVDTGISGAVAENVGRLLRRLGRQHQVLCVTHLPQVAAQANQHLRAEKQTGDDARTRSALSSLDAGDRTEEIARMLGGAKVTDKTRENARELLDLAVNGAS